MLNFKLSEEARYGIFFVSTLLLLLAVMALLNFVIGRNTETPPPEKKKQKTVIITQAKQDTTAPKPLPKTVVSTVREAIARGDSATAYIEINNVSKSSPEYKELSKMIADEARKQKAPGIRKQPGVSPLAPVRYLDESTPADRSADAIFIYFVDVSSTLVPRFCIQTVAKKALGITGFTITADGKAMDIIASPVNRENTEKGVAEWYDVPLNQRSYEAVQAIIRSKKTTLTITGSNGKTTRDVTDTEKKAFRKILDGYIALGGNLDYLQGAKPAAATAAAHPSVK